MTRTDGDSWDITTSVGATAVVVALARAAETNSANPLIRDEFAEPLVSTPELVVVRTQADAGAVGGQQMINYQAVRTHFFDAFFTTAAADDIRQHVILAAGLDSRAYRLNWPDESVVYEVDLPKVLRYKAETLKTLGATPVATLREVAVDLRDDWPAALRDAGFDDAQPTAWLAEGLLPFLHGSTQESMFTAIDELSAKHSRVAVEVLGLDDDQRRHVDEQWREVQTEREKHGKDASFDLLALWYDNEGRPDCAEWFGAHGWATRTVDSRDESERLGRPPDETAGDTQRFLNKFMFLNKFVTAEKA